MSHAPKHTDLVRSHQQATKERAPRGLTKPPRETVKTCLGTLRTAGLKAQLSILSFFIPPTLHPRGRPNHEDWGYRVAGVGTTGIREPNICTLRLSHTLTDFTRNHFHGPSDAAHQRKAEDPKELEETCRRAAKRRETNKRYYESLSGLFTRAYIPYVRHPEVREKNRERMKAKREAVKLYQRQWDPPKKPRPLAISDGYGSDDPPPRSVGSESRSNTLDESGGRSHTPNELVAHAALTTMYRMSTILHGARVPLGLAQIEAYQSSESQGSDEPVEPTLERSAARQALTVKRVANRKPSQVATEEARLDRERAARMRIHVETR
ncbi:hypothetical protein B0H13DRAFT_1911823 [Mycena leptocephala]|nr:hypothetical protein B0H13DRAFT_1911823 [Mycena leptocephala]